MASQRAALAYSRGTLSKVRPVHNRHCLKWPFCPRLLASTLVVSAAGNSNIHRKTKLMIAPTKTRVPPGCWRCMQWMTVLATLFAAIPAQAADSDEPSLYAPPCSCEVKRAGKPWCHFPWARQQVECDYVGYYVGGGAPGPCSRGRCVQEGTWGWDYTGRRFKRKVKLHWSCLHRKQGGAGSYQPDGPRVVESIKHRLEKE